MVGTPATSSAKPSVFAQPKALFALAYACVISFMGIGLVDPILASPASKLPATPSQALFGAAVSGRCWRR